MTKLKIIKEKIEDLAQQNLIDESDDDDAPLTIIPLRSRGIIAIQGQDTVEFLNNLLTNDVSLVNDNCTIFATMLTPQGKLLFDCFISQYDGDTLLLDCHLSILDKFIQELERYKLNSDVTITNATEDFFVACISGEGIEYAIDEEAKPGAVFNFGNGIIYVDPRSEFMEARMLSLRAEDALPQLSDDDFAVEEDESLYEFRKILCGIVEIGDYIESGKENPMDLQYDMMGAFDFDKGCYLGQEVISKILNKGQRKYSLLATKSNGITPEKGDSVTVNNKVVGTYLGGIEDICIIKIKVETATDIINQTENQNIRMVVEGKCFLELITKKAINKIFDEQ